MTKMLIKIGNILKHLIVLKKMASKEVETNTSDKHIKTWGGGNLKCQTTALKICSQ